MDGTTVAADGLASEGSMEFIKLWEWAIRAKCLTFGSNRAAVQCLRRYFIRLDQDAHEKP
jgi:hypothetical protein